MTNRKNMPTSKKNYPLLQSMLDLLRISLGLILLWAFFDKLFGLGFDTCADGRAGAVNYQCGDAWIASGSPTSGFLEFGTSGPLQSFFNGLAGYAAIDWLFMLALLLGGIALILGIGIKLATAGSATLLFLMWLATFPPEHHPFFSEHIIYILVLAAVCLSNSSQRIGLGPWWRGRTLVQRHPILV